MAEDGLVPTAAAEANAPNLAMNARRDKAECMADPSGQSRTMMLADYDFTPRSFMAEMSPGMTAVATEPSDQPGEEPRTAQTSSLWRMLVMVDF
jgi:hypothetical protein